MPESAPTSNTPGEPRDDGLPTSLILLERLRSGDDLAAEQLFARYFERLVALARSKLAPRLAQRTDPEDIVLSVYRSFLIATREGRYTWQRGGDLWRLLAEITKHKLFRQARHQKAQRRSVELELPLEQASTEGLAKDQAAPSPEEAVILADEVEWILSQLNPFGRRVLELRLQGASLSEIAEDTKRSERSVRRYLSQIRDRLAERFHDD